MDWFMLGSVALAMVASATMGGLIGLEREAKGRWAGLRTHMMVALGSCLFVLASATGIQTAPAEVSRVIQGIAAGVGFIGAGTIIKLTERLEVKGLTTASSIWTAAAVGTVCGLQKYELAITATLLSLVILVVVRRLERWLGLGMPADAEAEKSDNPRQKSNGE
jgi:putative Mg2+ transporter-C (MgtC) family protein